MWYALFPIYDDSSIYMDKSLYPKYYCQNKKCQRMLRDFGGEWQGYPVLKHGCIVLSSMNMYLATDSFVALLHKNGCNDFQVRKVKEDMNILDITATCELREESIDDFKRCPQCGTPLSITFSRGFDWKRRELRILKSVDDGAALLCRSRYPCSDSGRAMYLLFARDDLAKVLRKTKCFDMLECVDVEGNSSETVLHKI